MTATLWWCLTIPLVHCGGDLLLPYYVVMVNAIPLYAVKAACLPLQCYIVVVAYYIILLHSGARTTTLLPYVHSGIAHHYLATLW